THKNNVKSYFFRGDYLFSIASPALALFGLRIKNRILFLIGYIITFVISLLYVLIAFNDAGHVNLNLVQLGTTIVCLWFLATVLGLKKSALRNRK
ncbi:hypothetical protein, partial [Fangia hongkongensis]|uniref:hypothetical protein n=1 Tax=Fangia hongkongensis TaxID=270495 RepID=UPI001F44FF93